MRKSLYVLFLAGLLLFASKSIAQITITQDSYPGAGQEYGFYSAMNEQTVDLGSAGANQTWDFSGWTLDITGTFASVAPGSTPFGSQFPTATISFVNTTDGTEGHIYSYQRITSDGVYYLGMITETTAGNFEILLDEEVREIPLPLTYTTPNWTVVSRWTYEPFPGFGSTTIDSVICDVDAWGTVQTAFGTHRTLRILEHEWMTTIPTIGETIETESINYTWMTSDGIGSVNIIGPDDETDPDFTEGLVTVIDAPVAIDKPRGPIAEDFSVGQNYPNPFNPTTSLPVSLEQSASLEVTVYNELGEVVSHKEYNLSPGEHAIGFNGSQWASGNYFAQIKNGSQQITKKMQLVK